jgi:hypothetical protein
MELNSSRIAECIAIRNYGAHACSKEKLRTAMVVNRTAVRSKANTTLCESGLDRAQPKRKVVDQRAKRC